jgi:hypothetical protein
VLTEPFRSQVTRVSTYQPTDRPMPYIVVDHPLQMISSLEMEVRARQIVAQIERLLDNEMDVNS